MSDCIHCDIHDLLEPELARDGADLGAIAAKVTEVLADLVVMADPQDRAALLADVIANLGHIVLEKIDQPQGTGGRRGEAAPALIVPFRDAARLRNRSPAPRYRAWVSSSHSPMRGPNGSRPGFARWTTSRSPAMVETADGLIDAQRIFCRDAVAVLVDRYGCQTRLAYGEITDVSPLMSAADIIDAPIGRSRNAGSAGRGRNVGGAVSGWRAWTGPPGARPDRAVARLVTGLFHRPSTMGVDPDPNRAYLAVMSEILAERGVSPHLLAAGGGGVRLWCAGGARLRALGLLRDHGIFRNRARGDCGVLLSRP